MDKERFNALLADINQIDDEDIKSLNQLRKAHPYFQNQYVMIAKALKDRDHPKTDSFIKKAAIYAADRSLLKGIIMGTHDFGESQVEAAAEAPAPQQPEKAAKLTAEVENTKTEVAEKPAPAAPKAQEAATAPRAKEAKAAPKVVEAPTASKAEKVKEEPKAPPAPAAKEKAPEPVPTPAKAPVAPAPKAQEKTPEPTPPVKSAASQSDEKAPEVVAPDTQMLSDLEKDLKEIREKKRLIAKMLEQSEAKEAKPKTKPKLETKTKSKSKAQKKSPKPKKSQSELIEKFIQNEPQMEKQKLLHSESDSTQEDLAAKNIKVSDEFYTETLALLMTKQKKYKRAVEIYEKLSLKFPEKRAYFASQIEKVNNNSNV